MPIKNVNVEYCEINGKYDLYIDGGWCGKWYDVESALKGAVRRIEREK